MPARCVVLRVRCPAPPGSCSPVCPLGVLCCVCGVLGLLAPVHRCARSVCCFACAVSWASWLLFTGVPARCVVLRVRCPGPPGSCSLVCPPGVLCWVCGVLGLLAPVHRCARSLCCFACAVSPASWLLFTGVPARCAVLRVRCTGPPGSRSPVCPLGVLCWVCVVLGLLAPVHRCVCSVCCFACAVSWASWLLFTGVPARCVLLRVRCPAPPGSCLPVCPLGVLFCVCGVLGLLAPVHRCAPSVCCSACAVSWAYWLLFTGVPARCAVLRVRCPGPPGSRSPVCPLGVLCWVCVVLGLLAPVHRCARSVCCFACAVSWASWLLFTGVPARCVVLRVRCPGPPGSCSSVCPLGVFCCVYGVLRLLTPVHRCACLVCRFACAVSWASWILFTAVPARCVVLRVRCPGPLGSCSPVCPLGVLFCVCGVLGLLAPVHRCARSVCCFPCAVSWASWLVFTGVPTLCVVLRVWCPGPLGSCSPVCPRGVLCCVRGVLGHLAPVHRCACSVCCFACAVSWASWLLFTSVPARCVVLGVRCPGPPGSCSPVCPLGVLFCVCGVLGHLAPVHRCARSLCFFACAVSWASWLRFTGVPHRCVVLRVRCPGHTGSCSPVCPLRVLCWVCGVLGHLAPVHRCARSVCCFACALSCASWLLFTGVPARCVVLGVRCPRPPGSCSPVCPLGVLFCVCGVLGLLAPVHRCARSVCCFACAVSWASWLLFTGVPAWCVVLGVRCPGPPGSCSPVCMLGVLFCVCGVPGLLAPVHRCARSVCCFACAVSWAFWLPFPGVPARCVVLGVRCPGPPGSCSPVCPLGVLFRVCGVLGLLAPVHQCARSVCCSACAVSWATWLLFTGVPPRCVLLRVRCPAPPGSCSPVCMFGVLFCVCGVLGHLALIHRCARSVCCFACAVSWASWLLFTAVPARCVVLRVWCPGPLGSCSPVCPLGVLFCVCGVLGLLAPVHRCARSVCCFPCAVSWASWLLFTGVPTLCVVLRVRCPGPLGSCSPVCPRGVLCCVRGVLGHLACSPVCPLGVLFCVCGVLGLLAPVHQCARSVCCVGCAVSWASWLLFTGVPARCVVLRVRCPGPPGSCSPVCPLVVFFCVCGVLGLLAPVHRCACSVCCVGCAVSWASWLLFTAVPAGCVVLRVRCPGPPGSCSPPCPLGVLFCVCGVLGLLARVHRCARSVCCVGCAVSWASWHLFTGVPARCVVFRVRCPGPPGTCSPVCPLGVLFWVCGVLGLLAPVHRCARSVCCFACAVSWASWLLFTGVPARCVVSRVQCPGPPGSCSLVCPLCVLCCVCGVLGHLPPVHRCARAVCCVACAVSWATWLLFTGVPARCVVLRVRCPGPPGSCSTVCPLGVLCWVCGVLGLLAPVHRCARSVCCFACAVSWATWLLFTGVPARCVFLRVRCPGPPGSGSPVCLLGVLCRMCGVLGLLAPVHRCARWLCCFACAVSWASWLLFTAVLARCVVLGVRCPGTPGSCSPVCPLGVLFCVCGVLGLLAPVPRCARSVCCVGCALSWASSLLITGVPARCVVSRVRRPGPPGSCSPMCPLGVLFCVCGVLGLLAPVHRCARSMCCCACAVPWASGLLFTGVPARCVVLRVRCPGPPGSCSTVCPLGVLCWSCGVLGLLAPVHRCARPVCCFACAVSWASRLLFTGVPARFVLLRVRCPGPPGSCSPVCPLGVLCWVCGVLGLLAPVHRCARLVCCFACAVSWASWLLFTGVPARCAVLLVRCPGPPGSCSPVCPLGVLCWVCGVLGLLAPVHRCARSVCCFPCAVSWASWHLFTGVPAWCVVLRVRCPGPPGSCSPMCPLGVFCCVYGLLRLLAPVHRCARSVCCVVCAVSWATWLPFTGVPARCVVSCVRCPGPPGSFSPVCPLGVLFCVCGVLGHLAPVHRCARSVCCFACAVSCASGLLFTGVPARCVVLGVRCPRPPGSRSPVCPLGVLFCVCGVLGLLAPVHRCASSVCCFACAVSWATWLLFTGVPARCVVLGVRCPGPPGSCSPVCPLGVFCCVCGVLGLLAPVHRCACSVCCFACAVSLASWLVFTGVPARCAVLRAWCPGPPGSCSLVCPLGVLCCVCGVLGLLAPVHRCARSVCCFACAVSWASWLLFTGVLARCVVLRVRCPGPPGSCSPVCPLGVLFCVCGVLGLLARVHRCARSVCCVGCAVSWASWHLFPGVPARCVVFRVRCPGPPGTCSPVCPLGVLFCVCRVLGLLPPVHRCARSVCCCACAVSWASWLLFTGVPARCVLLRVRSPAPPGSCSPVCPLGVLCCVCGVLGHLAPVYRCARSVCCFVCAVSWASWLLFTGVPARCVVLRVRCPGPLGSCSPVCPLGVLFCMCGVLRLRAPVHRCARSVCCVGCAVSSASWLPFPGVPARCVVLRLRCPGPPGSCSPVCQLGVLFCVCGVLGHLAPVHRCARSMCCVGCAVSWASWLLFTGVPPRCVLLRLRCLGPPGSCSPVCPLGVLFCVCGVLGLLDPVPSCARSVCCVACAVSWASWLLFTVVPARCVVSRVRCPGPPGSCSPVCPLGVLCLVCGVLGLLAPVHRCARSVCCFACAVSWATWLLFTDVPARCVVLRVRCPGPPGSCSPVCPLGVLLCVCGVLGLRAPVHRFTRSVCCFACAVSWASWLLFTGVPARCVVLGVRCPGPPGSCSPVCSLGVLFCVCGVLGLLAPVHRCARSLCCFACAVSWASWLLFTGVPARCVVLGVRCPGPPGSCSPVCSLGVLFCVCGVLGLLLPVHRCARSVRCFACAASWATWLPFTGAPARCVVLRVRCPGPLGSCSPVCPLGVLFCVCGVLGPLAPVHRCARSVCCVGCAVSWASWLLFTGVPARCVVLRVRCPGPPGSCSLVCPLGVFFRMCGVLDHLAPVHRCARSVCCFACAESWASWLLFTGVPARCVVLRVRCPGPPGSCSPVCPLGVLCCVCGVLGHLAPVHRCVRSVCCALGCAWCVAVRGVAAGRSLVNPDGGCS